MSLGRDFLIGWHLTATLIVWSRSAGEAHDDLPDVESDGEGQLLPFRLLAQERLVLLLNWYPTLTPNLRPCLPTVLLKKLTCS